MASGKASKKRRAAERAAPRVPARRPTGQRADRRIWVAAAAAAAVVLAVVIGIVSTRGGGGDLTEGATLPEAAQAAALFEGIPQEGVVLGRPEAPVTLVEFIDMQCPFCREFAVEALPSVIDDRIRKGDVRMEIRGLTFIGPDSERGLRAVLAAGLQNRAYEVMELLYYNQGAENAGWLSDDLVAAAARSVPGVDPTRLVDDMDSGAVSDLIEEHAAEAERRGVDSTPTVLVGKTGGELKAVELESTSDPAAVERAIAAALK